MENIMKYKDIVYKISDELMAPESMGVFEGDLIDWSTSCRCYIDSIPEVSKIEKLCATFDLNADITNYITHETPTRGFCKRYVYYFIIEVHEATDIVYYPYIPDSDHRHWINGELAFIGGSLFVFTATLKKGYNIFCVEKYTEGVPFVRIQRKGAAENSLISLTENNYWYKANRFEILHNKHIQNGEPFAFHLVPLDLINLSYNSVINMKIRVGKNGPIVYEQEVTFKEKYNMDLSFIPNMNEDECERLYVYFETKNSTGKKSINYTYLFRHQINPQYIEHLKENATSLLKRENLSELIRNEINYYIQVATDQITYFYFGYLLKQLLELAKDSNACRDYLYKPGAHNVYYYSNINNQYHHYYVVLPKDFDPSKKYPLLLTFQYGHVNNFEPIHHSPNFSARFAEREGAIYADIGGDGCTMGSYTGEAFLLSEMEHLLQNFPIDRKKVYAIANCAGNIAALNFVETYPHLFAGIYTRSTDITKNNIGNLRNVHCMCVFSGQADWVMSNTKFIKEKLNRVEIIYSNKYLDRYIDLILSQYTEKAIDMLMSEEIEEYPNCIHYRTIRNRSRRCYYIEIESIKKGKDFAEFRSKIDGNKLVILTKNCTGLRITLPPQINRDSFTIQINGKPLNFKKYYDNEICFKQCIGKGFEVSNRYAENICQYKGTGLLDVYMSPMRTINCDPSDNILNNVSNVFAFPATNTSVGSTVYYPIISMQDINCAHDCAFTIVDNNCKLNELLALIRSQLPIQMDSKGYHYKGTAVQGEYCILQILSNPWHHDKSILYINTNNKELYTKNVFTRKLTIPSYSSGYHPFLNGVALLFDGVKYYTVKEWGDDLKGFHNV